MLIGIYRIVKATLRYPDFGQDKSKTDGEKNIADYQNIPFAYLLIKLKFLDGQDKLKQLIEDVLAGKITEK